MCRCHCISVIVRPSLKTNNWAIEIYEHFLGRDDSPVVREDGLKAEKPLEDGVAVQNISSVLYIF